MKEYTYKTTGTCSRSITFSIGDENRIHGLSFQGGCNGNLKGIAALSEGKDAMEVMRALEGIKCGLKGTSCPDQLSKALREALGV